MGSYGAKNDLARVIEFDYKSVSGRELWITFFIHPFFFHRHLGLNRNGVHSIVQYNTVELLYFALFIRRSRERYAGLAIFGIMISDGHI